MTERGLHMAVARLLDAVLAPPAFFSTFPAGGGGKARGGQLKAMGLKDGVPDILIAFAGRSYWIELKTEKGRVSPEQRETHEALRLARHEVAVCRSVDAVMDQLRAWTLPIRGRIAA